MVKLNGLFQKSFEAAINPQTLHFLDGEIEKGYLNDRSNLNILSTRSKYFFIASAIGIFIVYFLDMYVALQDVVYSYGIDVWIFMGLLIPTILIEVLFFFKKSFKNCRGVVLTVVGTLTQFIRNYGSFHEDVFYPFVGSEYFIL